MEPESEQIQQRLQAAITAANSGEIERARQLLLGIVEIDEENKSAWLWLSVVVETDEDRRICLENVLVLDPHNGPALRGLDVLGQRASTPPGSDPGVQQKTAFGEAYQPATSGLPGFRPYSRYDDVWSRTDDLCAYCAHEITYGVDRCPNCDSPLFLQQFRSAEASPNLHILWVLLASASQLFLINVLADALTNAGWPLMALHALLAVLFLSLAVGVYFRQYWAYLSSIIFILITLFLRFLGTLTFVERLFPIPANPAEAMIAVPFTQTLAAFLQWLQVGALALALIWALLFTAPDFERVRLRVIARLNRNIKDPAAFDAAARRYADKGLWASAILHWQRAVANAPNNRHYMRRLGEALARLGFHERSLDALRTARTLTAAPGEQEKLDELLREIETAQAAASLASADSGEDAAAR